MKNIRKLRLLNGLTQVELAEKLGLSKFNISDYETGRTEPDIKTLKKIADFFDVSIDYLIDNQPMNEKSKEVIDDFDDFQFALYGEVRDLTDEQKNDILEMVKLFKKHTKKGE